MSGFSMCLIILDIWQGCEFVSGIKYVGVLNMLWYSYDNIIIVTNILILEFLSTWFVHPGAMQLTIFLTQVRRYKNNESW